MHGISADPNRFKEVFMSKYGKVRIFEILKVSQDSKKWVADPKNRKCDVEGGWFCRGQYPPALKKVLDEKQDFSQLEDFNKQTGIDEEYQKQYFENLKNIEKNKPYKETDEKPQKEEETRPSARKVQKKDFAEISPQEIKAISSRWEDTEETTMLWELISQNNLADLTEWLTDEPGAAYRRSADGRGPMWWAYEYGRREIVSLLKEIGVSEYMEDSKGLMPVDMKKKR